MATKELLKNWCQTKERPCELSAHCFLFESNNLHKPTNNSNVKLHKSMEINDILNLKILEIIHCQLQAGKAGYGHCCTRRHQAHSRRHTVTEGLHTLLEGEIP